MIYRLHRFLVFSLLTFFIHPYRADAQWTPMSCNDACLFSDNGVLFNGGYGALSSTDSGTTWTSIQNGLGFINTTAFSAMGNDLIAGGYGISRSTNLGGRWISSDSGLPSSNYFDVSAFATVRGNLFAGTNFGIFRSTDSGVTWELSENGLTDTIVQAFAQNGDSLFAATTSGIFLSTDEGATWNARGLDFQVIISLCDNNGYLFAGSNGSGAFVSSDGGATWSSIPSFADRIVSCIVGVGTDIAMGTHGEGVFFSTDNGTTWTTVNTASLTLSIDGMLFADGYLYAGSWRRPLSDFIPKAGRLSQGVTSLDFGTIDVKYRSDSTRTCWIYNTGGGAIGGAMTIDAATIEGTNRSDFTIAQNSKHTAFPYDLAANDSLGFDITYTAPASPQSDAAALQMTFGSSDSIFTVNLSGASDSTTLANAKDISQSLDTMNFGFLDPSIRSDSTITGWIFNRGSAPVSLDSAVLTNPFDFVNSSNTKNTALPYRLENGDSIGIAMTYVPPANPEMDMGTYSIYFAESPDSVIVFALIGTSVSSSVERADGNPATVSIDPNPVSSECIISVPTTVTTQTEISVYNLLGTEQMPIFDGILKPGNHSFLWNARDVADGTYLCLVKTGNRVTLLPIIVTK